MAKQLAERPINSLPNDSIQNPRKECKTISLRSRTVINMDLPKENKKPIEGFLKEQREENLEEALTPTEFKKKKKRSKNL
ncbi:hypothetical protein AHAS_Ahas18G0218800 [Arachis hypogaea]